MEENKSLDLISLGSIVQDVLYKVDNLPDDEGLADILERTERGGGVAANFSVAFSKMGGRAGIISSVGDGSGAKWLLEKLSAFGIDTSRVKVRKGIDALKLHIFEDKSFRRIFFLENRRVLRLSESEIDTDYVSSANILFVDFFFGKTSVAAIRKAKSLGVNTVAILPHAFDVMETWGLDKRTFIEALDHLDALFLSDKTLLEGFPENWHSFVDTFSRKGIIVITLGSRGSLVCTGKKILYAEALKVRVRDTTGAGDTYAGVFTYFYFKEGRSLEDALAFATAAAAMKCMKMGAWSSPNRRELEEFMIEKRPSIRELEDVHAIFKIVKLRQLE